MEAMSIDQLKQIVKICKESDDFILQSELPYYQAWLNYYEAIEKCKGIRKQMKIKLKEKLNQMKKAFNQTKFGNWLNKTNEPIEMIKTPYPNRLKLAKVSAILSTIMFFGLIAVAMMSPRKVVSNRTNEVFLILEPYRTIGSFFGIIFFIGLMATVLFFGSEPSLKRKE